MHSVLIVDDHTINRHWLKTWLGDVFPEWEFQEAENGQVGMEMALLNRPDVVLMDISMPVMDGIEATELIKKSAPDIAVIVMTLHRSAQYRDRAHEAGASGFVRKDRADEELVPLIESVLVEKERLEGV